MNPNSQNQTFDKPFTVRLTMLSDWHVGTGTGIPGSTDALLAKDREDFPCVPAKTIIGIWRDAVETLAFGLDGGTPKGNWSKWVEAIFGIQPNRIDQYELNARLASGDKTYSRAILLLQPARISANLRDKINSFKPEQQQAAFKQALTFIKPEIKIEEESGTSETNMLRFAEMGRIHTVLETVCELNFDELDFDKDSATAQRQKETIGALLIAGAKLVERIGGKRRRGAGRCKLEIVGKGIMDKVLKLLELNDTPVPKPKTSGGDSKFDEPVVETDWQKLDYTLTLETPVSIVTATLGNVSETLDFIPGTYLLPHLTKNKKYLFKHIANGDLQVSPATIEIEIPKRDANGKIAYEGARGLPVPNVIYYDKVGGGFDKVKDGKPTVYNLFDDKDHEKIKGGEQKKNYREGYVSSLGDDGKLPHHKKTPKVLLMHNTIKDEVQRPTEDVGGVYSRQAIAAGTVLRGEIRFKTSLTNEIEKSFPAVKAVSQRIRLGTSKKDDYGLAEIKFFKPEGAKNFKGGDEENAASENLIHDENLIVYLESDVLLRNTNLRQTNGAEDLKKLLEEELLQVEPSAKLCLKDSLIQTRRIESWHEGWGFPRPTLTAMQAGSCVRFEIKNFNSFDPQRKNDISNKLKELENSGIGERRGEGYGRIRFNPKILTEAINSWSASEQAKEDDDANANGANGNQDKSQIKGNELKTFAKMIEETVWREALQRAVLLIADDENERAKIFGFEIKGDDSIPPLNQIGGLRSTIMRLKDGSDASKRLVTEWLEHLEQTPNRIKRWDANDNEDGAKKKTGRIKTLIESPEKVWLILCEAEINGEKVWNVPPTLARSKNDLQKEFWAEAVRTLFDACARGHKRKL
jgi:CRISPR-associated protein Csx10